MVEPGTPETEVAVKLIQRSEFAQSCLGSRRSPPDDALCLDCFCLCFREILVAFIILGGFGMQ